jgi:asparagine synthase (glutamine-hydrolysing)
MEHTMCGIAGTADSGGVPIGLELLGAMAAAMAHRGPDDQDFYRNPGALGADGNGPSAALAFRRLSIIDVAGGRQPLTNEDGSIHLVFNGEIYNFVQLTEQLKSAGHTFATHSDAETVIHLYESHGIEGACKRLRGMFAFAIWDQKRGELHLARDRAGKKPLVYHCGQGRISFSSELASLLADNRIERKIDWEAVYHYLTFMCVPAPLTAFEGVRKLEPAHWLSWRNGEITTGRYWELPYGPKLKISREEACEAVREKLLEATRLRLMSEVPLGAFLSGGIDSSAVVAAMSRAGGGRVKTFSIGFEEKKFNELPYARMVAQAYGTEHEEFMIRPNALEVLPKLVRHYGEPYADSSAIPTYYLSQMTRRHVTVALNGDGGDESFTGYRRHYAMRMADMLHRLPGPVRKLGGAALKLASPNATERTSLVAGLSRFADAANLPRAERYTRWTGFFGEDDKRSLLTPDALNRVGALNSVDLLRPLFEQAAKLDGAEAAAYVDAMFYLPNDLLVKVDIATMANSLEGRSPLLDHELMELAATLPADYKLHGRKLKSILKEAVAPWLPADVLSKRKWGFAVPIGSWFRGEMREFVADHLLGESFASRGFFRTEQVSTLLEQHWQGRRDWSHHLWILLMFELWLREFFDR